MIENIRHSRRLRQILDLFPWTPLGLLAAGLSYGALKWLAYQQLDLVLLVVGYGGAGLMAASTMLVCATAAWLKLSRRPLEPRRDTLLLETEIAQESGFSLPSLDFLPFVELRWTWHRPAGPRVEIIRRPGRLFESVQVPERGQIREVDRRVVVRDVFGLAEMAIVIREQASLDVLPRLGGLTQAPELISPAGGDEMPFPTGLVQGDRFELQRYMPGDPARFIHWKVLGRTRKLMIRLPERSLSPSPRSAAFIIAAPGDDATAAVARLALEKGLLGKEWIFASDIDPAGASELGEALSVLMRSVNGRERAKRGLSIFFDFFQKADKQGQVSAIVFAPPAPGAWINDLRKLANFRTLQVVIGVDGVAKNQPIPLWRKWIAVTPQLSGAPAEKLQEVVASLSGANCEVSVLDRNNGQLLDQRFLLTEPRRMGAAGT